MRRLLLAVLIHALALPAAAHAVTVPAPEDTVFKPCGRATIAECGKVLVPLERPTASSVVSLSVRRVKVPGPKRGTVFALAGGPGQAATPFAEDIAFSLRRTLNGREVVTFDQRGIGGSGLLRCPTLEAVGEQTLHVGGAAADCAETLGPRRAFYTTRDSVEDLEVVRRAVGAKRVILFGVSYGTKLALAYAAAYPNRVERLILDSVVPADGPDPFMRESLGAIPRILRILCKSRCSRITPDLAADVAKLETALSRDLLRGPLVRDDGRPHTARLGRLRLLNILFAGDFDPTLRAAFPAAVRSAVNGDAAPILRLAHRAAAESFGPVYYFNPALFAATICEEGPLPWARTSPSGSRLAEARAAFAGTPDTSLGGIDREAAFWASGVVDLCRQWPSAPTPPTISTGPLPAVPALLLAGEDDMRTPVETAAAVAKLLPQATFMAVPDAGHSALDWPSGGCARRALREFLANRPIKRCRRKKRLVPLERIAPTSLAQLSPAPRTPGRPGRTATAVRRTLEDAGLQFDASFFGPRGPFAWIPGLRSGRFIHRDIGYELDRLEYVPGVKLSGLLRGTNFTRGYLRVFGRSAAPGRLRLRRGVLSGRLGGRRVRVRIPAELPRIEQHTVTIELDVGSIRRKFPPAIGGTVSPLAGR